jgi:hypothetical protein
MNKSTLNPRQSRLIEGEVIQISVAKDSPKRQNIKLRNGKFNDIGSPDGNKNISL